MRKVKTTIKVYDPTGEELGFERKETTVHFTLDLDEIIAYRPDLDSDLREFTGSTVYMKSGECFYVGLPYSTLDKLIPGDYANP